MSKEFIGAKPFLSEERAVKASPTKSEDYDISEVDDFGLKEGKLVITKSMK